MKNTQQLRQNFCALSILAILLLFSCNLQNQIVLDGEGRGSMALSLAMPDYMLENIDLLAGSIPGGDDLLKPESIATMLRKTKDISDVNVKSPTKGTYQIGFRFQNFSNKTQPPAQDFLEWDTDPDGNTRLSITINRQTYQALERRFPAMRENALLQLYGPAGTEGMSSKDYLDMIEYSFGAEARRSLPLADAKISIKVPGKILSQSGGSKKSSNTVEFRLRLLDFALLQQEKRYSVSYR